MSRIQGIPVPGGGDGEDLIDVDEESLAGAAALLHTKTKKDTVNAARWSRWPHGGGTWNGWYPAGCPTWKIPM
jgi:hypothetical protein